MANGGWRGTQAEWDAFEAPLLPVDPLLEAFAEKHDFNLRKNHKDWAERSLSAQMPLRSLIQVFAVDETSDRWKVWACVSDDRPTGRYWLNEMLADDLPGGDLASELLGLLDHAYAKLVEWNVRPDTLQFAVSLPPRAAHDT